MLVNINNKDQMSKVVDEIFDKSCAFKNFFKNGKTLNTIVGKEGRFLYVNKSWERALGYTVEELCAEPFENFIHPDDLKKTMDIYNKSVKGKISGAVTTNRYRTKEGKYKKIRWISSTKSKNGDYWLATAVVIQ